MAKSKPCDQVLLDGVEYLVHLSPTVRYDGWWVRFVNQTRITIADGW